MAVRNNSLAHSFGVGACFFVVQKCSISVQKIYIHTCGNTRNAIVCPPMLCVSSLYCICCWFGTRLDMLPLGSSSSGMYTNPVRRTAPNSISTHGHTPRNTLYTYSAHDPLNRSSAQSMSRAKNFNIKRIYLAQSAQTLFPARCISCSTNEKCTFS